MHYTCSAQVMSVDGALVTLSRPTEPRKQPRRGYARVAYHWPVRIRLRDGYECVGVTRNVSASGALVTLSREDGMRLHVGDRQVIRMSAVDRRSYESACKVIRIVPHPDPDAGTTDVAVHFGALDEVDRVRLELLVLRGLARRYLRVRIALDAQLSMRIRGEDRLLHCTTEDVSGSGCKLRCNESHGLCEGMEGRLTLTLDGRPLEIPAVSVIRLLAPQDAGCRFVVDYPELAYEARTGLVEHLMRHLQEKD
jgi:hypothetical protein